MLDCPTLPEELTREQLGLLSHRGQRHDHAVDVELGRRHLAAAEALEDEEDQRQDQDQREAGHGENLGRRGRRIARSGQFLAQHIALGVGQAKAGALDPLGQVGPGVGPAILQGFPAGDAAARNLLDALASFDTARGKACNRYDRKNHDRKDQSEDGHARDRVGDQKIDHVRLSN